MLSLSLYHWTDKLSSRKLCNRAFHLPNAENSYHYRKGALVLGKKKKIFEGKPPVKWIGSRWKPQSKRTRWSSRQQQLLHKDDCKLLSVAERWQGFLRDAAESGEKGGEGRVFWFEANKETTISCQNEQLGREGSASGEDCSLDAMLRFHTSSVRLPWPFYFHLCCQHQC